MTAPNGPLDCRRALERLIADVEPRVLAGPEENVGVSFMSRMDMVLDLIPSGEIEVAFENFCSNVYEYDIELSRQVFEEIAQLGISLRLNPERWVFLRELVIDG